MGNYDNVIDPLGMNKSKGKVTLLDSPPERCLLNIYRGFFFMF